MATKPVGGLQHLLPTRSHGAVPPAGAHLSVAQVQTDHQANGGSTRSANDSANLSWSQLQEVPPHLGPLCRGGSKRAGWWVCMRLTASTSSLISGPTRPRYPRAILRNLGESSSRRFPSCQPTSGPTRIPVVFFKPSLTLKAPGESLAEKPIGSGLNVPAGVGVPSPEVPARHVDGEGAC